MSKTYEEFKGDITNGIISDTEAALLYLKENFPRNEIRFPPIFFLHQVYALVKNKTKADKEVNVLQTAGKVIIYKLGGDKDNIAEIVVFTDDVKTHILRHTNSKVVKNFVDILPLIKNVFVDMDSLTNKYSMTSGNVRELVQESVLVIRDVGSYWLSFPRAGDFVRSYNCGRKEILRMIKKSKYSEILEQDEAESVESEDSSDSGKKRDEQIIIFRRKRIRVPSDSDTGDETNVSNVPKIEINYEREMAADGNIST